MNWTEQMWIDHLEKGSGKNIFQYCLDSYGYLLYPRAIQGHSGGSKVDHCKITWKFRTVGFSTSITLVLLMTAILVSNQV